MSKSFTTQGHLTVAVTGVGAIIGQGIIKSLRKCRQAIRVVGIDRNERSMGLHLCDAFHAKPACEEFSPQYLDFWQHTLVSESVDLVLPGIEADLFFLNENREALTSTGATLGLNVASLIDLARNKWLFSRELPQAGLLPIPCVQGLDWDECVTMLGSPPFLLKPIHGSGSRGIIRLEDETDFRYWSQKTADKFMVQRIIGTDDEEYTVGAFGFGDGESLTPIIFRRKLSPDGYTQYAEVVEDATIEQATRKLSAHFRPLGPTNYQFRKENAIPYLLEINPRLSSSSSLRACFGYNEVQMAIDFYLDHIRPEMPRVSDGHAWRYAEDFMLP
jgi:carbamoyl-phosphate synthase large subunit